MVAKNTEKAKEEIKTEEIKGVFKRIGDAASRCGSSGWKILAYLGNLIVQGHPLAKLGFFRRLTVVGLGIIALLFSFVCAPVLIISASAEIGIEKIIQGAEKCETSSEESNKE
jgi:hypothetical protein